MRIGGAMTAPIKDKMRWIGRVMLQQCHRRWTGRGGSSRRRPQRAVPVVNTTTATTRFVSVGPGPTMRGSPFRRSTLLQLLLLLQNQHILTGMYTWECLGREQRRLTSATAEVAGVGATAVAISGLGIGCIRDRDDADSDPLRLRPCQVSSLPDRYGPVQAGLALVRTCPRLQG